MEKLNILLTSVGRRSYLVKYFRDALDGIGLVHVANSSNVSPAFLVADRTVVTPLIYDSGYISFLIDYCLENDIRAVISLFDIDLLVLAQHKKEFEKHGITVIVSDEAVIKICNDKWNTYHFLLNNGLNAPKTYLSVGDALSDIATGKLSYPLIVKPRWGMGSIGVFVADNEEELKCFYKKIYNVIKDSYLKYESNNTPEQAVLIQEKLMGQEFGIDIINDLHGNYINTSVKKKFAMRSGETDCAITADSPILKTLGETISQLTNHVANMDVDVFLVDDVPFVLEMNARFGGGYPFSHIAGVNLPKAIVEWLQGNGVSPELLTENIGVMAFKDISIVKNRDDTV